MGTKRKWKERMRSLFWALLWTGCAVLALVAVFFLVTGEYGRQSHTDHELAATERPTSPRPEEKPVAENPVPALWTCVMHLQIKLPAPGKCPICGMELVPVAPTGASFPVRARSLTMSEEARNLAEVQTTPVKRERAYVKLRMVGMVFDDETRIASLTARVEGRLDEVHVNFTGVQVTKGDPMVTIWSPTLIKSQVELFETIKSKDDEATIRGAEEKLMQYGMTKEQVERIRENKKPELYVTLRAPISGIVMKKMAVLGQFVKEGQDMFVINDLSHVWVKLDAYEPDLPWIRYGQEVTFTSPSFPGKTFKGKVIFIEPVLEMETRTVKVRVDAENPDYELKPHMFVNAELEAEVDDQGRVIKREWVGKYVCPFDPKEVSDLPGTCPKTKQPLRPATAYGYSGVENPVLPLVVPDTAVLFTGKRSLVYVEVPNHDQPTYAQRDVILGPRAGNSYVIYGGLKEGERVVVKGNFEIDSSVQISGQPSMMNPVETPEVTSEAKKPAPRSPGAHAGHGAPGQE